MSLSLSLHVKPDPSKDANEFEMAKLSFDERLRNIKERRTLMYLYSNGNKLNFKGNPVPEQDFNLREVNQKKTFSISI